MRVSLRLQLAALALVLGCGRSGPPPPPGPVPPFNSGPFADLLVVFSPGQGGESADLGDRALGAADGKAVKLGDGGVLIVGVTATILHGTGPDFDVVLAPGAGSMSKVEVYASELDDDNSFVYTGTVLPGATGVSLDASGLARAIYIRLVSFASDIAIDAITVLHQP